MVDDEPVGGQRHALLLRAADDLGAALTPLLRFARGGGDEGSRADLAEVTRDALVLYRHGERKLLAIDERLPDQPVRVDMPPSAALQAVVHLLLACDPVTAVALDDAGVRVAPAREASLDEVVAARIAADRGGAVVREDGAVVLRLPPA